MGYECKGLIDLGLCHSRFSWGNRIGPEGLRRLFTSARHSDYNLRA